MTEAKHTAGPWALTPVSWAHEDRSGDDAYAVSGDLWGHFAKVVVRLEGEDLPSTTGIANARLISAAPDLKEALIDLLNHYIRLVDSGDAGNWNPETEIVVKDARAAIAKATGQSVGDPR